MSTKRITRRTFVKAGVSLAAMSVLPLSAAANEGLKDSDLIYLTPIKKNGEESSCQSEIWFVWDGKDIYVCTASESWRARAPSMGVNKARIWVGDLGVWTHTDGKYKTLPQLEATASIISNQGEHERILDLFSDKYPLSWTLWGPRFRSGLEDGSRTMLKYSIA